MRAYRKRFTGSWAWFIFWILLCFPIAILYYLFSRGDVPTGPVEVKLKR